MSKPAYSAAPVGLSPLQNEIISKINGHTNVLDAWPASHASSVGIMTDKFDIVIDNQGNIEISHLDKNKFIKDLRTKNTDEVAKFFAANSQK